MKYLRKFENALVPTLLSCFDEIENTNFKITYFSNVWAMGVSICPNRPDFFQLDEDTKDDIISSIGKASQIGYKLDTIVIYSGIHSKLYYYSIDTFGDFKKKVNFKTSPPTIVDRKDFRFDQLTKINVFFTDGVKWIGVKKNLDFGQIFGRPA